MKRLLCEGYIGASLSEEMSACAHHLLPLIKGNDKPCACVLLPACASVVLG